MSLYKRTQKTNRAVVTEIQRRLLLNRQLVEALRKLVAQCESMGRASHTNAAIEAAHAVLTAADQAEKGG